MSQNPFEAVLRAYESVARGVQAHASRLFPANPQEQRGYRPKHLPELSASVASVSIRTAAEMENSYPFQQKEDSSKLGSATKEKSSGAVSKEELGRATWTLLHMIAAKFPEHPTRQQKRDAKELMAIISRLYPCKECADHFKEILSDNPVAVGSQEEFTQWLCHVHNVVNRSLGKPIFPCQRVEARWNRLDCEGRGCDLGASPDSSDSP